LDEDENMEPILLSFVDVAEFSEEIMNLNSQLYEL